MIDEKALDAGIIAVKDALLKGIKQQVILLSSLREAFTNAYEATKEPPATDQPDEATHNKDFGNSAFRKSYISAKAWLDIANQIRELRGNMSQEAFAEKIEKPQSVVSRLENPDMAKSLQSVFDVANAHSLGVSVRLIPLGSTPGSGED